MESDLRQWLLIIGPLLVLGVVLHGYYRMQVGRNELKMNLDKSFLNRENMSQEDAERWSNSTEFPNGGARVIKNHIVEQEFREADYYPDSREEEISLEQLAMSMAMRTTPDFEFVGSKK